MLSQKNKYILIYIKKFTSKEKEVIKMQKYFIHTKTECNEIHFEIVDNNNDLVESFDFSEYSEALKKLKQLNYS